MRPLAELSLEVLRNCTGLFADLDDTITTQGRLTADAYHALERLHEAGLLVVVVTGRPAGWCDHIARMWPVSAVVGENGAFYMKYDRKLRRLRKRFLVDEGTRQANRDRLDAIGARILREVSGTALASDQRYREADLAIDFCEDVPPLSAEAVSRIVALMQQQGLTAKVSSIHVNGWFGNYDKLTCARLLLDTEFGLDLDQCKNRSIFVGDSPNDAPMFAFFPVAVGVANVRHFAHQMEVLPAFITAHEGGGGFVEVAGAILRCR